MCGFLGVVQDKELTISLNEVYQNRSFYTHRGPDYQKIVNLNNFSVIFNRLEIVKDQELINQPYITEDKKNIFFFNGEIYNYFQLKTQLEAEGYFHKSNSEIEVLSNCYHKWGDDFVDHLDGMFVICIFNCLTSEFRVFNDHVGIKPFYYIKSHNGLVFSSEIKDLLKFSNKNTNINQANTFLYFGVRKSNTETFYEDIKTINPSSKLIFKDNDLNVEINNEIKFENKIDYKLDDFRKNTDKAINSHLCIDYPNAILLSGGIDSSIIAYNAKVSDVGYKCFSISPKNTTSEKDNIIEFVNKYNLNHEFIEVDELVNFDSFERFVLSQDEPVNASNYYYQNLLLNEVAKQNFRVCITGDGADELLGGYNRHAAFYVYELIKNFRLFSTFSFYKKNDINLFEYIKIIKNFISDKKSDIESLTPINFLINDDESYFNGNSFNWYNISKKSSNLFKSVLKSSIYENDLYIALRAMDRSSMSYSIENRVPFLDKKIVNFYSKIKTKDLYLNHQIKGSIKDAYKDILTHEILNKKKQARPGNNKHIIGLFHKELIDLLNTYSLKQFNLNNKEILNYLSNSNISKDSLNMQNDSFFFRLFNILLLIKNKKIIF